MGPGGPFFFCAKKFGEVLRDSGRLFSTVEKGSRVIKNYPRKKL
jgi:hypothetical protein